MATGDTLNICRSGSSLEPESGPDRVLPADSFTSCSPAAPVKLWMPGDHEDCDDEDLRWADKFRIEYEYLLTTIFLKTL